MPIIKPSGFAALNAAERDPTKNTTAIVIAPAKASAMV
jgi:hypothetical protein